MGTTLDLAVMWCEKRFVSGRRMSFHPIEMPHILPKYRLWSLQYLIFAEHFSDCRPNHLTDRIHNNQRHLYTQSRQRNGIRKALNSERFSRWNCACCSDTVFMLSRTLLHLTLIELAFHARARAFGWVLRFQRLECIFTFPLFNLLAVAAHAHSCKRRSRIERGRERDTHRFFSKIPTWSWPKWHNDSARRLISTARTTLWSNKLKWRLLEPCAVNCIYLLRFRDCGPRTTHRRWCAVQ